MISLGLTSNWTVIQDVSCISEDGSSSGEKLFVFWQPPAKQKVTEHKNSNVYRHLGRLNDGGRFKSAFLETAQILAQLTATKFKTITFCNYTQVFFFSSLSITVRHWIFLKYQGLFLLAQSDF